MMLSFGFLCGENDALAEDTVHELAFGGDSVPGERTNLLVDAGCQGIPRSLSVSTTASVDSTSSALPLEYTSSSLTGKKPRTDNWVNQDRVLMQRLPCDRFLVAVFDGHGEHGHLAAASAQECVAETAPTLFAADTSSGAGSSDECCQVRDTESSTNLNILFSTCEATLSLEGQFRESGTTASCAIIDYAEETVTFAHVGDTKMVLERSGRVVFESEDHKFDAKVRAAINDAGGEVRQKSGVKRIYRRDGKRPGLAISRSLGDFDGKDVGLNPEPQIVGPMNFEVGDSIIIASDGLWDMMRPDEAAARVALAVDVHSGIQSLVETANARWHQRVSVSAWNKDDMKDHYVDDISAVIVRSVESG